MNTINSSIWRCSRLTILAVGVNLLAGQLFAQDSVSPSTAAWTEIADLPNLAGVWEVTFGAVVGGPAGPPEFTERYERRYQAYLESGIEDSPMANCVPPGMPAIMGQPYPIEILLTPGKVTLIAEAFMQVRHIYTDGRSLPASPDPAFNGHSVGLWANDTLVVETIGLRDDTWFAGNGTWHSPKMRIVERFQLLNDDTLEIEMTLSDPEALVRPYSSRRRFERHADWTITEYVCQENNRNFVDGDGKAGINLELDQ